MDFEKLPSNYNYLLVNNEKDILEFKVKEIIDGASAKVIYVSYNLFFFFPISYYSCLCHLKIFYLGAIFRLCIRMKKFSNKIFHRKFYSERLISLKKNVILLICERKGEIFT